MKLMKNFPRFFCILSLLIKINNNKSNITIYHHNNQPVIVSIVKKVIICYFHHVETLLVKIYNKYFYYCDKIVYHLEFDIF